MTPEIGIIIAQALIKYGPDIAAEIATIFSRPTHTLQDWLSVFEKCKTYGQLDAESKGRVGATP